MAICTAVSQLIGHHSCYYIAASGLVCVFSLQALTAMFPSNPFDRAVSKEGFLTRWPTHSITSYGFSLWNTVLFAFPIMEQADDCSCLEMAFFLFVDEMCVFSVLQSGSFVFPDVSLRVSCYCEMSLHRRYNADRRQTPLWVVIQSSRAKCLTSKLAFAGLGLAVFRIQPGGV